MKFSKLISAAFIFCFCASVQAQFSIGLKGGYTKAWEEYGDVTLPEDAKIHVNGINVSALAYYRISKHFEVGVEPGFVQRGAACEPGFILFNQNNEDTRLLMNYVELPLLVSTNWSIYKDLISVFGKVGAGASMATKVTREIYQIGSDEPPIVSRLSFTEESAMRRWDYGFYGGLGFAINVKDAHQIFIASEVYLGMRDVDVSATSKNRGLNFNLGYRVAL